MKETQFKRQDFPPETAVATGSAEGTELSAPSAKDLPAQAGSKSALEGQREITTFSNTRKMAAFLSADRPYRIANRTSLNRKEMSQEAALGHREGKTIMDGEGVGTCDKLLFP